MYGRGNMCLHIVLANNKEDDSEGGNKSKWTPMVLSKESQF